MFNIKHKIITAASLLILVTTLIPTTIQGYATDNASYVESISSSIQTEASQSSFITSETKLETHIDKDALDVTKLSIESNSIVDTSEQYINSDVAHILGKDDNNKFTKTIIVNNDVQVDTDELNWSNVTANIRINETSVKTKEQREEERKAEEERKRKAEEAERKRLEAIEKQRLSYINSKIKQYGGTQGALLNISNPDYNYNGQAIYLTDDDRWVLEHLLMGEAGDQGFAGLCLVAQCIHDAYIESNATSIEQVRQDYGYEGSLEVEPNDTVKEAIRFIFDEGGMVVRHKVLYFYAFKKHWSGFHESQEFIIEHKDHRLFNRL